MLAQTAKGLLFKSSLSQAEEPISYRLYPRGFMGPVLKPHELNAVEHGEERTEVSIVQSTFVVQDAFTDDRPPAHPVVVSLMKRFREDPDVIRAMGFREELLTIAKMTWLDPQAWIKAQGSSAALTTAHLEYLMSVVEFIQTGKQALSHQTWSRLIKTEKPKVFRTEQFNRELYTILTAEWSKLGARFDEVMMKWMAHPQGYSHLLQTLNILLGEDPNEEVKP